MLGLTWPLFITCVALAKAGLVRAGPRGGGGRTSSRRLEPSGVRRE